MMGNETKDTGGGKVVHVLSGVPYDLYVGRAMPRYRLPESPWANPYKVGRDGDLDTVLRKFEEYISYYYDDASAELAMVPGLRRTFPTINKVELAKLDGLALACWCADKDGIPLTLADPEVCHGQILLRLAAQAAADLAVERD
jgi:hypothetical protein